MLVGWTKVCRMYASQKKVIKTIGTITMTIHLPCTRAGGMGSVDMVALGVNL